MKKKIRIEGMTCQHCVSRVKSALQELDYSASIKVNLSKKEAIIKTKNNIEDEVIVQTITEVGYKVSEIL